MLSLLRGLLLCCLVIATAQVSAREPAVIYLAGDSTLAAKLDAKRPETGWGEALPQYFRDGVRIDNRAQNGRSTRTFIAEGRWQAIVDALRPGDFVLIEFGHNDASKEKVDRYTPPADYRSNLVRFVDEARAHQATPILLTPVARRKFDASGRLVDTHGEYPDIVRAVGIEKHIELIDMQRLSAAALVRLGAESSRALFLQLKPGEHPNYPKGIEDNTHFSPRGAALMAELAVDAMRTQKLSLTAYLKPTAPVPPSAAR